MTAMAELLVGRPYVWGGGHGGWQIVPGYDCSGFVSAVLHAAGYLATPQTTDTLPSAARHQDRTRTVRDDLRPHCLRCPGPRDHRPERHLLRVRRVGERPAAAPASRSSASRRTTTSCRSTRSCIRLACRARAEYRREAAWPAGTLAYPRFAAVAGSLGEMAGTMNTEGALARRSIDSPVSWTESQSGPSVSVELRESAPRALSEPRGRDRVK